LGLGRAVARAGAQVLGRAGGSAGPVLSFCFEKNQFLYYFIDLNDVCDFLM
jgi:hypothetical protein